MIEFVAANLPLVLAAVGLVLIALEALSPGAHLMVIGVALFGAGLAGLATSLLLGATLGPIFLAAIALVVGMGAAYVYRDLDFYGGSGSQQTTDRRDLAGTIGYATETITPRSGEVKLEGGGFNPYYSARTSSGEIPEGEDVIVVDPGGGNVVTVEPLGAIDDDEIDRALARDRAEAERDGGDREGSAAGPPAEGDAAGPTETVDPPRDADRSSDEGDDVTERARDTERA